MNLNTLFETFPFLQQALAFLEQYAGAIFVLGFFLLMASIWYWLIAVLPRRMRQIYATLVEKGYRELDTADPEMAQVLSTLAPIYAFAPLKDAPIPKWEVQHACKRKETQKTRYILDVSRTQFDSSGVKKTHPRRKRESIMILEQCVLNFPETIYIKPAHIGSDWESRFGLSQVHDGFDQKFLEQYHVFTKSGKVEYFPDELESILLNVLQHFVAMDIKQAFYIEGITLAFRKDGWGICTGERLYSLKKMELVIDVAEMISQALEHTMKEWAGLVA